MARGRRGGFPGGMPGGGNMNQLMKQAQKMQEDMQKAQQELESSEVEYSAGGGMVTCKMNGEHKLLSLTIDPDAVDPEDVEILQDMIVAAVNGANEELEKLTEEKMGRFNMGGMGGLGGFGL